MIEAISAGSHTKNPQRLLSPVEDLVPWSLEASHASSSRRSPSLSSISSRQRRLRNSFEHETIARHSMSAPATPISSNVGHSMQIGSIAPNYKHNRRTGYDSEPDENTKQLLNQRVSPLTSSIGNPSPNYDILYPTPASSFYSTPSSLQFSHSPTNPIPTRTHSLSPQRSFDTTRRGRLSTSL